MLRLPSCRNHETSSSSQSFSSSSSFERFHRSPFSYEAPKAQVVRRFQNLGIQRANPSEYVARYGTQLEDAQSLISQARNAGVVEDIVRFLLLRERNSIDFAFSRHRSTRPLFDRRVTKIINRVTSVLLSLRQRTNTTSAASIRRSTLRTTVLPVGTRLLSVFHRAATNRRTEERPASRKVSAHRLPISIWEATWGRVVAIKPIQPSKRFPNRLNSNIFPTQ